MTLSLSLSFPVAEKFSVSTSIDMTSWAYSTVEHIGLMKSTAIWYHGECAGIG